VFKSTAGSITAINNVRNEIGSSANTIAKVRNIDPLTMVPIAVIIKALK